MSGPSLNDILAKIEQRLESLHLHEQDKLAVSLDPLSEVGLYITRDQLLADLYRQYLESQRNYIATLSQHGAQSPMTEIAETMSESSYCAMETRLIELRQEKELADKVQRLQEKQRRDYEDALRVRQAEYARRGIKQPQAMDPTGLSQKIAAQAAKKEHKQNQDQDTAFWSIFALSYLQAQTHSSPGPQPAAHAFARVAA